MLAFPASLLHVPLQAVLFALTQSLNKSQRRIANLQLFSQHCHATTWPRFITLTKPFPEPTLVFSKSLSGYFYVDFECFCKYRTALKGMWSSSGDTHPHTQFLLLGLKVPYREPFAMCCAIHLLHFFKHLLITRSHQLYSNTWRQNARSTSWFNYHYLWVSAVSTNVQKWVIHRNCYTKLTSKRSLPLEEQVVVTEHANEVTKKPIQELLSWRIIMTCEKLFWNPIP